MVERYPVNDYAHFCLGRALTPDRRARARPPPPGARGQPAPRARATTRSTASGSPPSSREAALRALVQRVRRASVAVDGREVGGDRPGPAGPARRRAATTPRPRPTGSPTRSRALRVFDDADGRMNEPLGDREVLCVSQFTLYARHPQGQPPELHRRGAGRARRAAVRALLRAARRASAACSAPGWRSSSSTTAR